MPSSDTILKFGIFGYGVPAEDRGVCPCRIVPAEFQNENRNVDILKFSDDLAIMKTVSVREMKAQWAEIEEQVARGEIFEVLNRGKPVVRIVSAVPRRIVKWEDHLATAIPSKGKTGQETVDSDREGRW